MVAVHNVEISWALRELADILEFLGEDFFKVRAYRRAAKIVAGLERPAEELYRQGVLGKIPGIGRNILAKIGELLTKGEMEKLKALRSEVPAGILEIMALPGIGPRRARFLYEQLGVTSLEELERAAREKKVRALKGMGVKTEMEILRSIEMVRRRRGEVLLPLARELARELAECVREAPGVLAVSAAGGVRRWQETVSEIILVAAAKNAEPVIGALAAHRRVREVIWQRDGGIRVQTWWGIPAELRVVEPQEYGIALIRATGSEEHCAGLFALARKKGFLPEELSFPPAGEDALWPVPAFPGAPLPPAEEEVYRRLGLWPVPPELREGGEELEAARQPGPPRLVEPGDLKGDLHVHSDWSDGASSILQLVERAKEKGYRYIAITDHSRSLGVARGLSLERLEEQHRFIRELNEKEEDFRVLTGVEVEILPKGGLDFPEEVLAGVDVVVASIHSGFRQDRETITGRLLEAIKNEHVDIIAHPTGRLLGEREAYAVDMERVLEAAARYGKILEINSSPDRLDLDPHYARLARRFGVKLAINSDAHDLRRLDEVIYGVAVARKAWLGPEDVVNTVELPDLLEILGRR